MKHIANAKNVFLKYQTNIFDKHDIIKTDEIKKSSLNKGRASYRDVASFLT